MGAVKGGRVECSCSCGSRMGALAKNLRPTECHIMVFQTFCKSFALPVIADGCRNGGFRAAGQVQRVIGWVERSETHRRGRTGPRRWVGAA
ncbi:hypothetical protein ppKF707_1354 [Metapseudomonas furukawaii]|uniref:Uncharacterized protein n=1 Tax=Metapseudomonas furukawaii TaxID=1149133 RepID=A0AAD1FH61_METFU|nr:hypothetical protein ppKF707_1354 [Pseudomonas furukawaii]BAU75927.1 hypothetical protein KF707C_42390 [Pseudomonas furukawaii]